MSTLKVEILKIENIEKHPNADRLDIIQVLGWNCIVQKDSFKIGDLCLYIPIDSILPEEVENKIFGLNSKIKLEKHRVRTIKLRKIISQGLVVKPEQIGIYKYKENEDYTEFLKIKKYEPQENLPNIYGNCNKIKKMYINSNFHKYTDIENIKNYPQVFQEGDQVYISEKLHGTSFRCGWVLNETNTIWKKIKKFFGLLPKWEFIFGSRNVQLSNSIDKNKYFYNENIYVKAVIKYDLKNKLKYGEVLYGEIIGNGIQSGYSYGCKEGEIQFYAYDLMLIDRYLYSEAFREICIRREIPLVPKLYIGFYNQEIINKYTEGQSLIDSSFIREGCIIKSIKEEISPYIGRKVLKSINPEYLLLKNNSDWH